jgi:hypothetical protein
VENWCKVGGGSFDILVDFNNSMIASPTKRVVWKRSCGFVVLLTICFFFLVEDFNFDGLYFISVSLGFLSFGVIMIIIIILVMELFRHVRHIIEMDGVIIVTILPRLAGDVRFG